MRVLLLLSLIALSSSISLKNCLSPMCTREYSPVCAVEERGKKHYFNNSCLFKSANCRRKERGLPRLRLIAGDCRPERRQ